MRAELLKLGAKPAQILTFYFGIPRATYEKLAQTIKTSRQVIICSPRLHEPIYQIKRIIEAFYQIAADFPVVKLWLLGDGSLTGELKQYVRDCHLEEQVHFFGRVTPADSLDRIAASQILVSIPTSDGTPVSLLEGMAAGCLPILSNLPVYYDWIQDGVNGLIISPNSADLAAALRRSIADQNLRAAASKLNPQPSANKPPCCKQFQPMLEYYQVKVNGG